MNLRKNDKTGRWFSTGFMVGGVGAVDAGTHTLKDAVMIRPGEALGHGVWIDAAFCQDIATRCGQVGDKGLKARFGHPNMCSEALGTFLGRWKGGRVDEMGRVMADLHLSSTAAESPKGDLRKYVEEMAAKEPGHFGASIVFSMDYDAAETFMEENSVEALNEAGQVISRKFKSPDPANVGNLPHARCAELHAADLVDDPAATDGMFSGAGGMSLAAQMTEFLDTHPEVFKAMNDEPELLNIVTRYADELQPFLARYAANAQPETPVDSDATCPKCGERFNYGSQPETSPGAVACPKCGETCTQSDCDEDPAPAEPGTEGQPDPAETGEMQARIGALELQVQEKQTAGEKALDAMMQAERERDELAEKLAKADAELSAIKAERDEALNKLAAIEAGKPPVSNTPAETTENAGSLMQRARKKKQ